MASQKKRSVAKSEAPVSVPPPKQTAVRTVHIMAAVILILITLLAYSNSFHDGYTLDNNQILRADKRIQSVTSQNLSDIWNHTYWWPYGESGLYRPLATFSYMFNYAVLGNGENTTGYHWINFLLHICNILLVYALGLKLLGSRGRAFALAALWAVHPVLTESVTNMVGRPDLLAGFGLLGGFLCYLIGTETTGNRRWLALAGAALATAIGSFSKESGITVAGVIAIYELVWWKERRAVKGRLAGCAAVGIPILAMLLRRMSVLSAAPAGVFPFLDNPLVNAGFLQGRLTAIAIMARYLWRLVCPITLSADYSYNQIPVATGTATDWVCWLVMLALAIAVVCAYRWNRLAFFFAGFAAVTFLPGSNLLFPIGTIMAERFLYLPAIAFCACLVLLWSALPTRVKAASPVVVSLLVGAYAVRTWMRNPDWWTDLSMARALAKTSPNSFKVQKMLAFQTFRSDSSHTNLDEAIADTEKSMAILKPVPDADSNAETYRFSGGYYYEKGEMLRRRNQNVNTPESVEAYRRAEILLKRAIEIMGLANADISRFTNSRPDPAAGDVHRVLSMTYRRLNEKEKAYDAAIRATEADPVNPEMYLQLSKVLADAGQLEGAAVTLLEGSTLTHDKRISKDLLDLFRGPLDPDACAVRPTGDGMALNPQCPSVKRLLCPAVDNCIRVDMRVGRPDLAADLQRASQQEYGCPVKR